LNAALGGKPVTEDVRSYNLAGGEQFLLLDFSLLDCLVTPPFWPATPFGKSDMANESMSGEKDYFLTTFGDCL